MSEVESILAAIEGGNPKRTCDQIATELAKAIPLLEAEGQNEDAERLRWCAAVCFQHTRLRIGDLHQEPTKDCRFLYLPDLPADAIVYLSERAVTTANPVLKARLCDYLWEKNVEKKYRFALLAIDAYLQTARLFSKPEELKQCPETADALDRAADLAMQTNSTEKLALVIHCVAELIEQLRGVASTDDGFSFPVGRNTAELMSILLYVKGKPKYGKLVSDSTVHDVQRCAKDLALEQAAAENYDFEQVFLTFAAHAAQLRGDGGGWIALQLRHGDSFERQAESRAEGPGPGHMVAAHFFELAFEHYAKLFDSEFTPAEHRPELSRRMVVAKQKMREMNQLGQDELKPIISTAEIPLEDWERAIAPLFEPESLDECLLMLGRCLHPSVKAAEESANELHGSCPLLTRMSQSHFANDIRVTQASSDEDKRKNLVAQSLLIGIGLNSQLLPHLFSRLVEQRGLDATSLARYLDDWGVIDPSNAEVINVGLRHYFNGDYISALHILVPQFEDVLRTILEKAGAPVIRPRRTVDGWEFEPFGTFLTNQYVQQAFSRDLLEYLRLVMTEPAGWNLRNEIAHGLVDPEQCTMGTTDVVLHLYLALTNYRLSEQPGPSGQSEG